MNKKFVIFGLVFVIGSALVGGLVGSSSGFSPGFGMGARELTADYREALEIIQENYAGEIDRENLSDMSIQSMLWALDPHSSFFTADEFRKLYEEQASQFYGIGVSIMQYRDGVYVQSAIPGTPAEKAGLRYGDRFVTVDGKDAREWTSSEVSKNVRGPRGTNVRLEIERPGSDKPVEFVITRGGVPLPSVRTSFMLKDGIGYIGLTGGFQETSANEVDQAMEALRKQGMTSLILDVRNNPGGLLTQAREITSRFIPPGKTVVSVKGRSAYAEREELKTGGTADMEIPLVVMINGRSASASEIVAGAVQDYDRGVIVGNESFGKGLVQRVFPLPFGTGLTLTTARYYTPYGRSLQRDYSNGSIYEYYSHSMQGEEGSGDPAPKPAGSPVTTASGRTLYGGRGIEPDVVVDQREFTPVRQKVVESAFFFVRRLAYGKIDGFESLKADRSAERGRVDTSKIVVSDELFAAFKKFVAADKRSGLSLSDVDGEAEWVRIRLREEIATALFSTEAGQQVLLEADPQVLKAVEAMGEAKKLVVSRQ